MSSPPSDYVTCLQRLLREISHRHEPPPSHEADYWNSFHAWIRDMLAPTSSWKVERLTAMASVAGGMVARVYPYSSTQLRLLYAKLNAVAIILDDSVEDPTIYDEITNFCHRLYIGETQQNPMLVLFHSLLKELSSVCGNDAVLRGLTVVPWLTYVDACLLERSLISKEPSPRLEGFALKLCVLSSLAHHHDY